VDTLPEWAVVALHVGLQRTADRAQLPSAVAAKTTAWATSPGQPTALLASIRAAENGGKAVVARARSDRPRWRRDRCARDRRCRLRADQVAQSGGRKPKAKSGRRKSENQLLADQMTEMMSQLKTGDTLDLLASSPSPGSARIVLTLDTAYASDPTLSDLIDGEYRVLRKVTPTIPAGGDETINLLRKTTLGRLQASALSELARGFQDDDSPFDFPEMETEVPGPAVQILPIAIFA